MSNVVTLRSGSHSHPEAVLEEARGANLGKVVVFGWTQDGRFYVSGSESFSDTIFLLRNAEHELFKDMDAMEDQ